MIMSRGQRWGYSGVRFLAAHLVSVPALSRGAMVGLAERGDTHAGTVMDKQVIVLSLSDEGCETCL